MRLPQTEMVAESVLERATYTIQTSIFLLLEIYSLPTLDADEAKGSWHPLNQLRGSFERSAAVCSKILGPAVVEHEACRSTTLLISIDLPSEFVNDPCG